MNSYLFYRASFYLMLVVATMTSSGDSVGPRFGRLLPIAVALAGAAAFVTVDLHRKWALPRPAANVLAALSLAAVYVENHLEGSADAATMIVSLGHWLIYLQMIKYFLPKQEKDDWFLFLLGLMQVLIGAVTNPSDQVGAWLFVWAMLAVCVLSLFFLQREAHRFLPAQDHRPDSELKGGPVDPYRGLFHFPFAVETLRVITTTIALGGLIFLVLPRRGEVNRSQAISPVPKHLTGFDDSIQLGQLGEILENDSVVFTVSFTDENAKAIAPPGDPLWRGVTMVQYEHGQWARQSQRTQHVIVSLPLGDRKNIRRHEIRQKVKLEPTDSTVLFGIRPIRRMDAYPRLPPYMSPLDGTLFRPEAPTGPYDYEIASDPNTAAPQTGENPPNDLGISSLTWIPEDLKARLRTIALPVVAEVKGQGREAIKARARALESWLRDSREFSYSLRMHVENPRLDPVEDFLVNRKEGHCEYFASALALLLRSIDIPSRLVNGFKGGDWNDLTQTMNVRQKHAHSWVEAYCGLGSHDQLIPLTFTVAANPVLVTVPEEPFEEKIPEWIALDPTPGLGRQESIAQVGGIAGSFRPVTDLLRHVWVFYVVGYDGERQHRLLYAPMRQLLHEIISQYAQMGRWLRRWFTLLFHFRDVSAFISIRGFIATFIGGSLLAGLTYLVVRMANRLLKWLRGPQSDATALPAGILFYRRMVQLLARCELVRTPAETQREFALRARAFLARQAPTLQQVAEVPQEVVAAFYRVRFGHLELEPASLQELDDRLDELEVRLTSP
jgi:hypothetical protein